MCSDTQSKDCAEWKPRRDTNGCNVGGESSCALCDVELPSKHLFSFYLFLRCCLSRTGHVHPTTPQRNCTCARPSTNCERGATIPSIAMHRAKILGRRIRPDSTAPRNRKTSNPMHKWDKLCRIANQILGSKIWLCFAVIRAKFSRRGATEIFKILNKNGTDFGARIQHPYNKKLA